MNQKINYWDYLSDAWRRYENTREISKFWEGLLRLAADLKLSAIQANRAKSLSTTSDSWVEEWMYVPLRGETYRPDDSYPGYPYSFALEAEVLSLPSLVNYPGNPTKSFFHIDDYIFQGKRIFFKEDPRDFTFRPVEQKSGPPKTRLIKEDARLYCPRATYDLNVIYKNFGFDVGFKNTGNEYYLKEMQGIYRSLHYGSSIEFIHTLLYIIFGYNARFPFSHEADIVTGFDDGSPYRTIFTANKRYVYPYFLNPTVELSPDPYPVEWDENTPGRLKEFQPLTDGVIIRDYQTDPEWFDPGFIDTISFAKALIFLDSLTRGYYGLGTFGDEGRWDDGDYLGVERIYSTTLDDMIDPTPTEVQPLMDSGTIFDSYGSRTDTSSWETSMDRALINFVFKASVGTTTIAEIHKSAFSKTTINRQSPYRVLDHVNCFFRSPYKDIFLDWKDRDVRLNDKVNRSSNFSESSGMEINYEVEDPDPGEDGSAPKFKEYEDNIVPRDRDNDNIDIGPVDIEDQAQKIIEGIRAAGTNLIICTTNRCKEVAERRANSSPSIYFGGLKSEKGSFDDGGFFDDWYRIEDPWWEIDPWSSAHVTNFDDIVEAIGWNMAVFDVY